MRISRWRELQFAFVLLLLGVGLPGLGATQPVEPLFDLRQPETAPFPSNRHTFGETRNLTGIRVGVPKPSCTARPSDCADIDVLNTLDGFNLQPRFRVPFSGSIDLSTVNSSNFFIVRLYDPTRIETRPVRTIGINQVVWDPATKSLSFESDEVLEQHTQYLMVVTTSVRDTSGNPLSSNDFRTFITDPASYRYGCCELSGYRLGLLDALDRAGIASSRIVSATLFTTMSTTAALEKIRDQIKAAAPPAANFLLGNGGSRTHFPIDSVTSIVTQRQVGTASFKAEPALTGLLAAMPGAVGSVSFGRYSSPEYMTTDRYIPEVSTRTGTPVVQRNTQLYFTLILPAGSRPSGGWPVAIYGHGFTSNRDTVMAFASVLASRGIATIAINVVGHGGGAAGTITVNRTSGGPVTLPAGGRGVDVNGDGVIENSEGISAMAPRQLIQFRDGIRQTVIDMMQLVRVIETNGIDPNGNGTSDLSDQRIYYFGISLGGVYGPLLLALDPSVRAGVPIVGGGTIPDVARMGTFRSLPLQALALRTPSLVNTPGRPAPGAPVFGFSENIPLRNQPPLVNNVAGAIAIQEYFERWEWVSNSGDPLAYIRHIREQPLAGVQPKPVIIQFAKGDKTVPNPTNSAMVRAGGLLDRTTYFRNDLAFAANPTGVLTDPHSFAGRLDLPGLQQFALKAQTQIGIFFQSDGATMIDPDGPGVFFETPIWGPLPETLNFIQ